MPSSKLDDFQLDRAEPDQPTIASGVLAAFAGLAALGMFDMHYFDQVAYDLAVAGAAVGAIRALLGIRLIDAVLGVTKGPGASMAVARPTAVLTVES